MKLWYGINDIDDAILIGIAACGILYMMVQFVLIIYHLYRRHGKV